MDIDTRVGLIGLVQHLHAASKDNKAFLRARFALGEYTLKTHREPSANPKGWRH